VLDSGDLFHARGSIPSGKQETVANAARLIVKAYNKQGCDGVGLGDRDLAALGVEELKKLASLASYPFLNANVTDMEGEPVFTPYVVLEKAGQKIGVFALVTQKGSFSGTEGYKIIPPVDAAREVMAALEKEPLDAIVLLAHMDKTEAKTLVGQIKGIDVLLGGQAMASSRFPGKMGEGWWINAGQKGQYLNLVQLQAEAGARRPFVMREDTAKLQREVASLDRKLKQYESLMNRPADPKGGRDSRPRIKQVIARMLLQRQELVTRSRDIGEMPEGAPVLSFEAVPMRKDLRSDDEVARWVQEFKTKAPVGCGG